MKFIQHTIDCLERSPDVIEELLQQIPEELYAVRRVSGKWSIHEQVCHLTEAQQVLIGRFRQFESEEDPLIRSYNPFEGRPDDYFLQMDMNRQRSRFPAVRAEMVKMLRGFSADYWERPGRHDAFSPYNSRLLLIHALNVDYGHILSIEQLGLTKPEFEESILSLP